MTLDNYIQLTMTAAVNSLLIKPSLVVIISMQTLQQTMTVRLVTKEVQQLIGMLVSAQRRAVLVAALKELLT